MTEDSKAVAPPDWVSKTLATLDAISGYTCAALAISCGLLLFFPPLLGIDLAPIQNAWGGWITAGMIGFALLAAARMARAIHTVVANALVVRSARRALELKQSEVLRHLDTLSDDERKILEWCVKNHQRGIVSNYLNQPLALLTTKGIFEVAPPPLFTLMKMPYLIPDFVWNELQQRKTEFTPKSTGNWREGLKHGRMA